MTNLDYALGYAKMGLIVFPIQPGTKRPMTEHGVKDATGVESKIREWWTKYPDAGIGLAARAQHVGDPCFLEFDQKPTLKEWAKNEGQPMPETRVHRSASKGAPHFLFTRLWQIDGNDDDPDFFGNFWRRGAAPPNFSGG
jgi:bifunctional DNA primase/polymerase-like protein